MAASFWLLSNATCEKLAAMGRSYRGSKENGPVSRAVSHHGSPVRLKPQTAPSSSSARSPRSEEHTSELQSLMRISYAVFCLKKQKHNTKTNFNNTQQQ